MSDEYTEVVTTSWWKRIVNSFVGILAGIVIFLAAFPAIWWNEGRSVDRIKTIDEGRGAVVSVVADKVDPNNEGALIHISGQATSDDTLSDALFGVKETGLKLKRTVEMYQWYETSKTTTTKNTGGSETKKTTYSYSKKWSTSLSNSSSFKVANGHTNPATMPYTSESFNAANVNVSAFKLTNPFISQISKFEDYALTEANLNAMDAALQLQFNLNGDEYFSGDPVSPQVGAMRVRFSITKPTEVSVIGKQANDSVDIYKTENGTLQLLEMKIVGAEAMFDSSESSNTAMTWAIRFAAFMAMWGGLSRILAPIKVIGSVLPFLGNILGAGIGLVTGVIAAVLTLITIALAWVFFRPIIGITLLVIAAVLFFGGYAMIKKKLKALKDKSGDAVEAPEPEAS